MIHYALPEYTHRITIHAQLTNDCLSYVTVIKHIITRDNRFQCISYRANKLCSTEFRI